MHLSFSVYENWILKKERQNKKKNNLKDMVAHYTITLPR